MISTCDASVNFRTEAIMRKYSHAGKAAAMGSSKTALLCALVAAVSVLAGACSSSPGATKAQNAAVAGVLGNSDSPTTQPTTAAAGASSTAPPVQAAEGAAPTALGAATTSTSQTPGTGSTAGGAQIAIPAGVIGEYPAAAKAALSAIGLRFSNLNTVCTKGTLVSTSVVAALELPGPPVVSLNTGSLVPAKSVVAIEWSGCYGKPVTVPNVVGMPWGTAASEIQNAGLKPGCTSAEPYGPGNTTSNVGTVTSESPAAGTPVAGGSKVYLTQQLCQKDLPPSGNSGGTGNTGNS